MSDNLQLATVSLRDQFKAEDPDWARKQRNHEYRVAQRREKRNRKADEKKQRKLNATLLRRMTRNPDKYNKNAARNRLRDIEAERRKVRSGALKQVQRLALQYDPSGATFNIAPVTRLQDGTIVSEETLRKRQERAALQKAKQDGIELKSSHNNSSDGNRVEYGPDGTTFVPPVGVHSDRIKNISMGFSHGRSTGMSKTQEKKKQQQAALESQPTLPKPIIPEHIAIPCDEIDWLSLWDIDDDELERRVKQEKNQKVAVRKAMRSKQQSGKVERRVARDEKRAVYREMKLTWKAIKEEQKKVKTKLAALEDEEAKKIAVEINTVERKVALHCCAQLGFTLANTPGIDEIKPRALGLRGINVDYEAFNKGDTPSHILPRLQTKRVDLANLAPHSSVKLVPSGNETKDDHAADFIKLNSDEEQDFQNLNYNHKLKRKLRRAFDTAEICKEMLVRQRAIDLCVENNIEPPAALKTSSKYQIVKGQMILENGALETAKQARVRSKIEQAEYNKAAAVLRTQAKQAAIAAGLRKHADLIGKLPSTS